MIAALSFLLDYEKIEEDDDSDSSSDEGDLSTQTPQLLLNKASVYKVSCLIWFMPLLLSTFMHLYSFFNIDDVGISKTYVH